MVEIKARVEVELLMLGASTCVSGWLTGLGRTTRLLSGTKHRSPPKQYLSIFVYISSHLELITIAYLLAMSLSTLSRTPPSHSCHVTLAIHVSRCMRSAPRTPGRPSGRQLGATSTQLSQRTVSTLAAGGEDDESAQRPLVRISHAQRSGGRGLVETVRLPLASPQTPPALLRRIEDLVHHQPDHVRVDVCPLPSATATVYTENSPGRA